MLLLQSSPDFFYMNKRVKAKQAIDDGTIQCILRIAMKCLAKLSKYSGQMNEKIDNVAKPR